MLRRALIDAGRKPDDASVRGHTVRAHQRGPVARSTSPAHSTRSAATVPEELSLGVRRGHGGRTLVGSRGLAVPAQPSKQIGSRRVERVVIVQVQLIHQSQGSSRAPHLADGDGAVEGHDRRGNDLEQLVEQGDDLRPSVSSTVGASAWTALMAAWI